MNLIILAIILILLGLTCQIITLIFTANLIDKAPQNGTVLLPSDEQTHVLSKGESQGMAENLKRIDALLKTACSNENPNVLLVKLLGIHCEDIVKASTKYYTVDRSNSADEEVINDPKLENLMEEKINHNPPTTLMIATTETSIGTTTEEYPSIVNENLTTTTTSEELISIPPCDALQDFQSAKFCNKKKEEGYCSQDSLMFTLQCAYTCFCTELIEPMSSYDDSQDQIMKT